MWRKNHAYIPHQNFWHWWWWFKNWYLGRALFIRFSLATGQAMTRVWRCWWPNLRSRWLAPPNADRYKTNPNWCWPIQIWCWLNHAYYINIDVSTVKKCPLRWSFWLVRFPSLHNFFLWQLSIWLLFLRQRSKIEIWISRNEKCHSGTSPRPCPACPNEKRWVWYIFAHLPTKHF